MLTQRIMAIALGYEDLNAHQTLRDDWLFQPGEEQFLYERVYCQQP